MIEDELREKIKGAVRRARIGVMTDEEATMDIIALLRSEYVRRDTEIAQGPNTYDLMDQTIADALKEGK